MSNDNSAVSTDNISVRFSGGVHHVQVGSMADGQSTPTGNLTSPAVQVTDTVHSVQFGGANPGFSSQGLSQFDTSDFARDTGSPLSTARNNGFPAGGDLRLDSVIKAGGTELTIENAMHMGWVRQAANGFEWIGPGSHPEVKKTLITPR